MTTCPACGLRFDPEVADSDTVKKVINVPRDLAEKFKERFPAHGAWTDGVNEFLRLVVQQTDIKPGELYDRAVREMLNGEGPGIPLPKDLSGE